MRSASPAPATSPGLSSQAQSAGGEPKDQYRIRWRVLAGIVGYHLVALLALLPWFFSWTGVVACVLGSYFFGTLGINIGYHRLLTHRGFRCSKWLEHALVLLGVCNVQESPAFWVAAHRRHHQFADDEPDPHSPLLGFLWAHVGWTCVKKRGDDALIKRHAADVLEDPLYRWLQRRGFFAVNVLSWVVFLGAGFAAALIAGKSTPEAWRFGVSLLLWGVFVRTVLVWHLTWSVNSVTHLWGYRTYDTPDHSRNNVLIGLLSNGEGWHNNHHADPTAARHGHQWWEFDLAYLTIRGLAFLGLARNIVLPAPRARPVSAAKS